MRLAISNQRQSTIEVFSLWEGRWRPHLTLLLRCWSAQVRLFIGAGCSHSSKRDEACASLILLLLGALLVRGGVTNGLGNCPIIITGGSDVVMFPDEYREGYWSKL